MPRSGLTPWLLTFLMLAGCTAPLATLTVTPVEPEGGFQLDLAQPAGGAIGLEIRTDSVPVQVAAWAQDVLSFRVRLGSAVLAVGMPGVERNGELVFTIPAEQANRAMTLLNLPATDPADPASAYDIGLLAIDRAGNPVNRDPRPDGYTPVLAGIHLAAHQALLLPPVQLRLVDNFLLAPQGPAGAQGVDKSSGK